MRGDVPQGRVVAVSGEILPLLPGTLELRPGVWWPICLGGRATRDVGKAVSRGKREENEKNIQTCPLLEGVFGTWGRGLGKVPLKKGSEAVWRIQLRSTNPTPSWCPPVGWCEPPLQLGLALMMQGKEMDCWGGIRSWRLAGGHTAEGKVSGKLKMLTRGQLKPWPQGPSSVRKEMKPAGGWWTNRTEGPREERSPLVKNWNGVWELASFASASLCMGVISYVAVRALPWVHFND